MGGPLISADAVDEYIALDIDDNTELSCIYLEVRYTRDTSLSLP